MNRHFTVDHLQMVKKLVKRDTASRVTRKQELKPQCNFSTHCQRKDQTPCQQMRNNYWECGTDMAKGSAVPRSSTTLL